MKALVFSDSHGRLENLMRAVDRHPDYQAIFHLGDVGNDEPYLRSITPYPVYIVRGNCDYAMNLKESLTVEFGGKRIAMCHGHRHAVYRGIDVLKYWALEKEADVVLFGHTHVPFLEQSSSLTVINPGSISKPRQEGHQPGYAVLEVDDHGEISVQMKFYRD